MFQICHSKSGDINPNRIRSYVEAYVNKVRQAIKYENKKQQPTSQSQGQHQSQGHSKVKAKGDKARHVKSSKAKPSGAPSSKPRGPSNGEEARKTGSKGHGPR